MRQIERIALGKFWSFFFMRGLESGVTFLLFGGMDPPVGRHERQRIKAVAGKTLE